MKFIRIIIFLSLFAGIACSKSSEKETSPVNDKPALKIMTYNIHIANPPSKPGVVDIAAIAKVINNEKPDLVALQEVDKFTTRSGSDLDQAKELARLTGMSYYFAKAIDRSDGEYGVAILSKFPIKNSSRYSLPVNQGTGAELRVAGIVEVELENKQKLIFAATHFDHLTDSNRELQARELLKAIEPYKEYPVIIGGDFNMPPANDVWNVLKTRLTMVCTLCPSTFPAANPKSTIDYILLNEQASALFSVKDYRTAIERYASDHLPLVLELEFKD